MIIKSVPLRINDVELLLTFDSEKALTTTEPDTAAQERIQRSLDDMARRLALALGRGQV